MAGYIALYREWRPSRFADVVGQEHVTRTLRNALQGGRLGHAYLFAGPRGTGKTSVAKILARAVNCLQLQDGEPCGTCDSCQQISRGQTMDVLEIDAASNRGIEEIRELRERVRIAPSGIRCKVYIIDEVHMLTDPAFNALLKTLEEPPPSVLFILATTEAHKIPATILSRCQRFDFHRIDQKRIMERLRFVCDQQKLSYTEAAIYQIARQADGGLRDALSLLDQCLAFAQGELNEQVVIDLLGLTSEDDLFQWLEALLDGNVASVFHIVERIHASGRDLGQAVRDLMGICRDALLLQVDPNGDQGVSWIGESLEHLRNIARHHRSTDMLRWLHRLADAERDMRRSTLPRVVLEMHLLEQLEHTKPEAVPGERQPEPRQTDQAKPKPTSRAFSQKPEEAPVAVTEAVSSKAVPSKHQNDFSADSSFKALWSKFLDEVKKYSPVAKALIESAQSVQWNQDRLELEFPTSFHVARLQEGKYADLITTALKNVYAKPVRLVCRVAGEPMGQAAAETAAAADDSTQAGLDPRVKQALDFFGGRIVDQRTEGKEEGQ